MKAYLNTRVLAIVVCVVIATVGMMEVSKGYDKCMQNASWAVCSR